MKSEDSPGKLDYLVLGVLSAAALAYEILLLRVFSFSQWHHFASLAVSLALLGFGVAGTLLALLGKRAVQLGDRLFIWGLLLGAGGMVLGFGLTQLISIRPLFAVWDMGELAKMLLIDFTAFLPFLGIGLCIGQVFMRWPKKTRPLYASNLLGSGIGALAASLLLATLHTESALLIVPAMTLLAGTVYTVAGRRMPLMALLSTVAFVGLAFWIFTGPPSLPLSDFKRLAYLLDLPDSEILERRPDLRGEVTIVRSSSIRTAPGLSLHWTEPVPPNDAIVLGSDRMIPLPVNRAAAAATHFKATLGALPFRLRPDGPAAILGTSEWLTPTENLPVETIWVQDNPTLFEIYLSRNLLEGIETRIEDPRGFLSSGLEFYSVIYFNSAFAAGEAVGEDYLLTTDALEKALSRLDDNGLVAIPVPLSYPPRYGPKLLFMAVEALERESVEQPAAHIGFLRSMKAGICLISKKAFSREDITTIREFSTQWGFDLATLPGLRAQEANRFHQLEEPVYFSTALALFQNKPEGMPEMIEWYRTNPPDDGQPYFWHSMKWKNVPGLVKEFGRRGLVWLDWSVLATVVKLAVAGLLAFILILLPLGRLPKARPPLTRFRVAVYFSALGLGFLLLEMAAFQKALLYLSDPVITASLVFSVFLVGAGLGSLTTPDRRDETAPFSIFIPILGTAVLAFFLLQFMGITVSGFPLWARLLCVGLAIAPLSWTLGMAFPWGLRQLDEDRDLIPWAWGINGFLSVMAAPLAVLLSVQFGQVVTWIVALGCYLVGWLIARAWSHQWSWY